MISAVKMQDHFLTILAQNEDHVMPKDHPLVRSIRQMIRDEIKKDPSFEVLRPWREKNVYNFYLRESKPGSKDDSEICWKFNYDTGAACTVFPTSWRRTRKGEPKHVDLAPLMGGRRQGKP